MHISMHTHHQYLAAEVLELSGNVSRDRGKFDFVSPDCVRLAIEADTELKILLVPKFDPKCDCLAPLAPPARSWCCFVVL